MPADAARRRASYQDLIGLPDHVVGEIVAGELHVAPRPGAPHAVAAAALSVEIGGPFWKGRGGPGGWVILVEPELHLGDDVVVPDLAGWRRSRMPVVEDVAAFTLAPDWTAEVLSVSTARLDRTGKLPLYARERVPHVWLVDPLARTLEVFRLDGEQYRLVLTAAGEQRVRAEPFDAIELALASLWAR